MRPEIPLTWQAWNDPFEGTVATMYTDILNLVTIGVGNLIDPVGTALGLPFVYRDGSPATQAEIATEWHRVKDGGFAHLGWTAAAKGATLHLTPEGITSLVLGKLRQLDAYLAKRFPNWEQWPASAQRAALSMAWAAGPALVAPHWEKACNEGRWAEYAPIGKNGELVLVGGAAFECHLDDSHNLGLRPRNAANKALFLEAHISATSGDNAPYMDGPVASETGISDTHEGHSS